MKKILPLALCISTLSFASQGVTLEGVVKSLNTELYKPSPQQNTLTINKEYFSRSMDDFEILRNDKDNYRITSKNQDGFTFYITKLKGHLKGIAYNDSSSVGYKINYSEKAGELVFQETDKSELRYTCGGADHSHHEDEVEKPPLQFKPLAPSTDVTTLQSKPNSEMLIYLDFDGEDSLERFEDLSYYNVTIPDTIIYKFWQAISEDFRPFTVNVTTDRDLFDQHDPLKRGWVYYGTFQWVSWSGLANLGSFGRGDAALVNVNSSDWDDPSLYRTGSHELGHTLNLRHDGGPTSYDGKVKSYYAGRGEFSPIMGNGFYPFSVWSNGNYPRATNQEDDIAIIGDILGHAADDIPNQKELMISRENVLPSLNFGTIDTRDDVDTFKVVLPEPLDFRINIRSNLGTRTNLDIIAKLYNSSGELLQSDSPIGSREANIGMSLDAGEYHLVIDGGGELDMATGFDDYSSLGYYEISGKLGYYAPKSSFETLIQNNCAGEEIQFVNTSEGSGADYLWTFVGETTTTSTEKNPKIIVDNGGEIEVSLKLTNLLGENISEQIIHVGNHSSRIQVPLTFSNDSIKGALSRSNTFFNFHQGNLADTLSGYSYIDVCLSDGCYDVQIESAFELETCDSYAWREIVAYSRFPTTVFHKGFLYELLSYSKGDEPGVSDKWKLVEACESEDVSNKISIIDLETKDVLFETTPKEVGSDLYISKQMCINEDIITPTLKNSKALSVSIQGHQLKINSETKINGLSIKVFDTAGKFKASAAVQNMQVDLSNFGSGINLFRIYDSSNRAVSPTYRFIQK